MEKKEKKYTKAQLALVIAFCAVIGLCFILFLALPKQAGKLSPLEFRVLQDHPIKGKDAAALREDIVKGDLSSNVDSFLEDHFPARKFFVAANAYYLRATGRNAVQPVIMGRGDRLYDAPIDLRLKFYSYLEENEGCLEKFAADNGLEYGIVIAPNSALTSVSDLPKLHLEYPDAGIVDKLRQDTSAFVPDLVELYSSMEDDERYFYRTDHHWTMDGAHLCYRALCGILGVTPVEKSEFTVEEYEFYGSYYRKSGLWLTSPDKLEIWRSPKLDNMTVSIGPEVRATVHKGVYDEEKLKENEIDKYAAYLYSNNGLTVIENPEGNGEALMIIKDSYGNSIAPLFAMNYSTVIMIDTRGNYYQDAALPMPSELVAKYGVTKLLVIMGTESIVSNSQLIYLR
ncbi:MAG: hypothetical protein K6G56_09455 [Clostridiales bacterium]|nr:hypothetical protein [Clostridiales bacterium]